MLALGYCCSKKQRGDENRLFQSEWDIIKLFAVQQVGTNFVADELYNADIGSGCWSLKEDNMLLLASTVSKPVNCHEFSRALRQCTLSECNGRNVLSGHGVYEWYRLDRHS